MAKAKSSAPHAHESRPEVAAGDPFIAAARQRGHDHQERDCFACYEGWIYLGERVEDPEPGEEVEILEAVPCRRCNGNRV